MSVCVYVRSCQCSVAGLWTLSCIRFTLLQDPPHWNWFAPQGLMMVMVRSTLSMDLSAVISVNQTLRDRQKRGSRRWIEYLGYSWNPSNSRSRIISDCVGSLTYKRFLMKHLCQCCILTSLHYWTHNQDTQHANRMKEDKLGPVRWLVCKVFNKCGKSVNI